MTDYERFDEFRSGRSVPGMALTFLLIGLGIGATTALLFAPKAGRKTRKDLRRRYEDARETMEDWGDHAGDFVQRGGHWARNAKKKVAPIAERFRR